MTTPNTARNPETTPTTCWRCDQSPRLLGQAQDRGEPDLRVDGPAAAEPEIVVEG